MKRREFYFAYEYVLGSAFISIFSYADKVLFCGLVVRVPGYSPGSIPGATRFSEKQCVWNGVHSAL
jgi:hypothetical protein